MSANMEPPGDLSPMAAEIWRRRYPDVWRLDRVVAGDLAAFCVYCETAADLQAAQQEYVAAGRRATIDGRPNPAVKAIHDLRQLFIRLSKEFGLTPNARGAVKVDPDKQPDRSFTAGVDPFAHIAKPLDTH